MLLRSTISMHSRLYGHTFFQHGEHSSPSGISFSPLPYNSISAAHDNPNQAITYFLKAIAICIPKLSPEITRSQISIKHAPLLNPKVVGVGIIFCFIFLFTEPRICKFLSESSRPPSSTITLSLSLPSSLINCTCCSIVIFLFGKRLEHPVLNPTYVFAGLYLISFL